MRTVIWFVLLFVVAVVAASSFGANDGLVTFFWGTQRIELSLNLFLLVLVGTCFVLVTVINAVNALVGLPRRAREWRVARRDRSAQAALRDALSQYFGGRYSRAQRSAQRALAIQGDTPELAQDNEFTVLGHLLAAGSAHRLQDRSGARRGAAACARAGPAQQRRAPGGGGRAAARRRMVARRPRRSARAGAARRAADRRRAPHPRAAPAPAGHATRAPAAGGAAHRPAAGQAPGLFEGSGAGAAALARVRVARDGARHRPAAARLARVRRDGPARSHRRRACRPACRRHGRERRGARLVAALLGAAWRTRGGRAGGAGAWRWSARARAWGRVAAAAGGCRAGTCARRRGRAGGRHAPWPSASSGARRVACSRRRLPTRPCRPRVAAAPGAPWRASPGRKAMPRAPPPASRPPPRSDRPALRGCYTARLRGCSSVG